MKKFRLAAVILALLVAVTAFSGCTYRDGVKIKFATVTLSYEDASQAKQTKDLVIALYTNFAPETTSRFIELAKDGHYDGTVVNNMQSSWFSLGGQTYENGKYIEKASGKESLIGEFLSNGFSGNTLSITKGSVIMMRDFVPGAGHNDSADAQFAIFSGTASAFNAKDFCVFGKLEADSYDALEDIMELRYKEVDDEQEYKYYYAGGIAEIAAKYAAGGELADLADDHGIEADDIASVTEGGDLYFEVGEISAEDYEEFKTVATKFIDAAKDNVNAYFYTTPYSVITIESIKISNRI